MLTRVAIFEDSLEAGGEDAFFVHVAERPEPIWRRLPTSKRFACCEPTSSIRGRCPS
jgi:hypothetical protein